MARKALFVSIAGMFVLLGCTVLAGPNMNPGKWEITTRTEMAGLPTQSLTHLQCITQNDMVPMSEEASQQCKITDVQTSGNTLSFNIACGDQGGGMSGTGTITYDGDTMNGTMTMTVSGADMTVKNTLTGKRIGACDDESTEVSSSSESTGDQAAEVLKEDAKEIGNAARDEVKKNATDKVRKGLRRVF